VRHLQPLQSQGWGEEEQRRLGNLGSNGPRDVSGVEMTHCVPNEHVVLAEDAEAVTA
jgi:catalase